MGRPRRQCMLAAPHCYCVSARFALGQRVFDAVSERVHFLALLERIRLCYDLRIYGVLIWGTHYSVILQHQAHIYDRDEVLQQRWSQFTGSSKLHSAEALRSTFNNLGEIMKSLNQGFSRSYHLRHGGNGSIWSGRYRSCLLADDSALLACLSWFRYALHSSHNTHAVHTVTFPSSEQDEILLSPPPLRELTHGIYVPSDEAALGSVPAANEHLPLMLNEFLSTVSNDSRQAYGTAIDKGWALGKAESLVPCLSQLSRPNGKGRSRKLHDLNDDLALCGIWG